MGSINRRGSGTLFFDFRVNGHRCREYTSLQDTPANRKKLQKVLDRMELDMATGSFEYRHYFPSSAMAARFDQPPQSSTTASAVAAALAGANTPLFRDFAETWFGEREVEWRRSYRETIRISLDKHLLPHFGEFPVGAIDKACVMAFRKDLAKKPGHGGGLLSASRVNHVLNPLRMILAEAAERHGFANPSQGVKSLKVPRTDVDPFTLEEVKLILARVRVDFRPYFTVRFFTAMRTSEVNGLMWKYVDFERRQILIRETLVAGHTETTKTPESRREIAIAPVVEAALREQERHSGGRSAYVFCARNGEPLQHQNVTNRIWYPLLRHLGLKKRRPYQTRHTAATLWLAAGESPEWIANQMGHTTTEMLFRTYSRFVPNLTRQDGSAMRRLLAAHGLGAVAEPASDEPATPEVDDAKAH